MKPNAFSYHLPRSPGEALELLSTLENARILAGGQSLMPMMNMRFLAPDHLIDINRIAHFAGIEFLERLLRIGPVVRQATLACSREVREALPILTEALAHVGHMQTRNRGTFGGSLCHLDPAAELPVVAMALGAQIIVAGKRGERRVSINDWPLAYMTPNLEPDEMLTGIVLTPWTTRHGWAFVEFARRHGDFAIVSVACLVELDERNTVRRASIALGGVDSRPIRLTAAETLLVGETVNEASVAAAAAQGKRIDALSDAYVTKAYRQHLAAVLVARALKVAAQRAQRERVHVA